MNEQNREDWRKFRHKDFWEFFAKLLLIEFVDRKEFVSLINADCPDLQNEKWGIEVRMCWDNEDGHRDSLCSKYFKRSVNEISSFDKQKMEEYGMRWGVSDAGIINCFPLYSKQHGPLRLTEYFIEKLKKIQKYQVFPKYGIFLLAPEYPWKEIDFLNACQNIQIKQKSYKKNVSEVFLYCYPQILYQYFFEVDKCKKMDISSYDDIIMEEIVNEANIYEKKLIGNRKNHTKK